MKTGQLPKLPTPAHRAWPIAWRDRARRGQSLLEQCVYESASGQLLSASFMDYAMPRADTLPFLVTAISEVPSPTHRLGIRGGGEGGTTPALAVVVNAIVDALGDY